MLHYASSRHNFSSPCPHFFLPLPQARRQCLLSRHSMLAAPRGRLVSAPCAAGTVPQTAAVVGSPGRSTAPRVLLADAGPTPDPKRDPSSQDPSKSDLGPHGPKLLPRPRRPQLDRIGGPGGPPGGGGPGSGGTQRVIANLVAYTGIVGTTAIVLAGFAGIDVWESFRWTNTNDLALAAALSVPLQAANAALLLPSFSALKLPHLADLKVAGGGGGGVLAVGLGVKKGLPGRCRVVAWRV